MADRFSMRLRSSRKHLLCRRYVQIKKTQICVWCWHHIMEMAEKIDPEGRCPACRNTYNKEKIVGTPAKCERMVSWMNSERKLKTRKGKGKTPEGRKQLESVRVIQCGLATGIRR